MKHTNPWTRAHIIKKNILTCFNTFKSLAGKTPRIPFSANAEVSFAPWPLPAATICFCCSVIFRATSWQPRQTHPFSVKGKGLNASEADQFGISSICNISANTRWNLTKYIYSSISTVTMAAYYVWEENDVRLCSLLLSADCTVVTCYLITWMYVVYIEWFTRCTWVRIVIGCVYQWTIIKLLQTIWESK